MATSIHAFLKEQQTKADSRTVTPIKVLLAKTDVNAASRINVKEYADFCDAFQEVMAGCPYVDIIPGQWRKKSLSTISETLIVNYVLKGIPTIIIFPVVCGDTFRIECSSWGFNKGLTAISFHNFFEQRITEGDGRHLSDRGEPLAAVLCPHLTEHHREAPGIGKILPRPICRTEKDARHRQRYPVPGTFFLR